MDSIKKAVMATVSSSERRLTPREVAFELAAIMMVGTKDVKRAMNELVFEGALEFTYYGGQSYIELPLDVIQNSLGQGQTGSDAKGGQPLES